MKKKVHLFTLLVLFLFGSAQTWADTFFGWYVEDVDGRKRYISYEENGGVAPAYPGDEAVFGDANYSTDHELVPVVTADYIAEDGRAIFHTKDMLLPDGITPLRDYNLTQISSILSEEEGGTIVLEADGALYGEHYISRGTRVLIPYNEAEDWIDPHNPVIQFRPGSAKDLNCYQYRTLTTMAGSKLIVGEEAELEVAGQQLAGSSPLTTGGPFGACGCINMKHGGEIIVEHEASLYCLGAIIGQNMQEGNNTREVGSITVKNGGTVCEYFVIGDWRGGTRTSQLMDEMWRRIFPFCSYYIQGIEVPMTLEYGAREFVRSALSDSSGGSVVPTEFGIIGTNNAMFLMADAGSSVKKWYDATTDHTCIELIGTAQLSHLQLNLWGFDVSSENFVLPIPCGMRILLKNCNMNLSNEINILPGAILEIEEDANVTVTNNIYVWDMDQWGKFALNKYFYTMDYTLTPHFKRDGSNKSTMGDGRIVVDGTLTLDGSLNDKGQRKGNLYTSLAGADVMGNGGGRLIINGTAAMPDTAAHQVTGTEKDWKRIPMYPVKLHNDNDSYTATAVNNTYKNVTTRWFHDDVTENTDHTWDFTYLNPDVDATSKSVYTINTIDKGWWSNVVEDTKENTFHKEGATDPFYNYTVNNAWLQLDRTETNGLYSGSDNKLYQYLDNVWTSSYEIDENCLYNFSGTWKARVGENFVEIAQNSTDEAYHNVANASQYYLRFEGCDWQAATKVAGKKKAYTVGGQVYIWASIDDKPVEWLAVTTSGNYYTAKNEQNVNVYYEWDAEAGQWNTPKPLFRVSDATGSKEFAVLAEALTYVNSLRNPTFTLLTDMTSQPMSFTSALMDNTITLDLNGHTITGKKQNLVQLNAEFTNLIITDNVGGGYIQSSTTQAVYATAGTITITLSVTGTSHVVYIDGVGVVNVAEGATITSTNNTNAAIRVLGRLNVQGGTITAAGYAIDGTSNFSASKNGTSGAESVNNDFPYATTISGGTITSNSTTKEAIYVQGGRFVMTGGTINSAATGINAAKKEAYIESTGALKDTRYSSVNIEGGTINAVGKGLICEDTLRVSDGVIAVTGTSDVYGVYAASGTTYTILTGGTISATATTSGAYGVYIHTDCQVTTKENVEVSATAPNTAYAVYLRTAEILTPRQTNVTIYDGTYTSTITSGTEGAAVYAGDCYMAYPCIRIVNGKFRCTINGNTSDELKYAGTNFTILAEGGYYAIPYSTTCPGGNYLVCDLAPKYQNRNYPIAAEEVAAGAEYDEGYRTRLDAAFTVIFKDKDGNTLSEQHLKAGEIPVQDYPVVNGSVFVGWRGDNGELTKVMVERNAASTPATITYTAEYEYPECVLLYDNETLYYSTVSEAWDEAKKHQSATLRLMKNCTKTNSLSWTNTGLDGQYLLFDLNGCTFTSNSGNVFETIRGNNMIFEINDTQGGGMIDAKGGDASYILNNSGYDANKITLIINGGTLKSAGFGFKVDYNVSTIINDGTLQTTRSLIYTMQSSSPVTIKGGKLSFSNINGTNTLGNFYLYGGFYTQAYLINFAGSPALATRVPSGYKVFAVKTTDPEYAEGYRYYVAKDVPSHTALFVDHNGTELYRATIMEEDPVAYTAAEPVREGTDALGYVFIGWRSSQDGQLYATDNIPVMGTANVTYTAEYNEIAKHAITFVNLYGNGDEVAGGNTQVVYVMNGATPVCPVEPTKAEDTEYSFEFAGWIPAITTVSGPATYQAQFVYVDKDMCGSAHKVTFDMQGHGDAVAAQTIQEGALVGQPTAPLEEGYTFGGWYKDEACSNDQKWNFATDYMGDYDITLYAKWTIITYTITWKDGNGATLKTTQVNYGVTPVYDGIAPTKLENAQYTYAWTNEWSPTIVVAKANVTYTATFTQTPKSYTLTWNLDGGEASGEYTAAGSVAFGAAITAPTVEKDGFIFMGWSPTVSETMPAENVTYTAQWASNSGESEIPAPDESVVATIKGRPTPYFSLEQAYNAANADDEIILFKDITLTSSLNIAKDITLNINKKKITIGAEYGLDIRSFSSFTAIIKNGFITSNGISMPITANGWGVNVMFKDLKITAKCDNNAIYPIYAFQVNEFDMDGCTISAIGSEGHVIHFNSAFAATEIKNSNLSIVGSSDLSCCLWLDNSVSVTIDGGTYSATSTGGTAKIIDRPYSSIPVTIKGGKFGGTLCSNTQNLTIQGGHFVQNVTPAPGYQKRVSSEPGYNYEVYDPNAIDPNTPKYTVTFNKNDGSSTTTTQADVYENIPTALNTIATLGWTRTGYTFEGWAETTNGDVVYADGTNIILTGNKTLYAKWAVQTFTVTFNKNDNSGTTKTQSGIVYNEPTQLNVNTWSRTGYDFAGWATTANGTVAYEDGDDITLTSDKTLYAIWTGIEYHLSYEANYTDAPIISEMTTVKYGSEIGTLLAAPARDGFTFLGWFDDAKAGTQYTASTVYNVEGHTTLYAHWSENQQDPNPDPEPNPNPGEEEEEGEPAPNPTVVARIVGNSTDYSSLQAAYNDAGDGDEIMLYKNVELSSQLTIAKGVTINLNKKKITISQEKGISMDTGWDFSPKPMTIKNGTISSNAISTQLVITTWADVTLTDLNMIATGSTMSVMEVYQVGYLGMENCSITASGSGGYDIYLNGCFGGLIKNCTMSMSGTTGDVCCLSVNNSTITIDGGSYSATSTSGSSCLVNNINSSSTINGNPSSVPLRARRVPGAQPCYTVVFLDEDGKTIVKAPQQYYKAYELEAPASDPTKAGTEEYFYHFSGWVSSQDGAIYMTADLPATVTANTTYTATYEKVMIEEESERIISNEQTLTSPAKVDNIIITETGSLLVGNSSSLTVTDLIVEATPSASGQLDVLGTISVTGNAHFDLTLNAQTRTWYAVAVPWNVDSETGISANGRTLTLGRDFDIIYYDGAARAAAQPNAACWRYVEDDANKTIVPGKFYLMFFARPYETIRFTKKAGADIIYTSNEVAMTAYPVSNGADPDLDYGWNGIANPKLYHAYMNAGVGYGTVLKSGNIDDGSFGWDVCTLESTQFVVGSPVFVQAAADGNASVSKTAPAPVAARTMANNSKTATYEVRIAPADAAAYSDRLYVSADENATGSYTIGKDLLKMGVASKSAQMWVNQNNSLLAVNTAVLHNDMANFSLGISAPQEGMYTISLADVPAGRELYLLQNGSVIANLSMGAYTIYLQKGTCSEYSLRIGAVNAPGQATDLEEAVVDATTVVEKVVINGKLYIITEGHVYDAVGRMVK